MAIVLPAETDGALFDVDQPVIGDGHAVGVAPDISSTWSGPAKGGLAYTTHAASARCQVREGLPLPQRTEGGEEAQFAGGESLLQIPQEQAAEQTGQHPNRQEEPGRQAIQRGRRGARPPGHAMQMGMMEQFCPQVWSTAKKPSSAPRCLGSAAMVRKVSAAVRNRML